MKQLKITFWHDNYNTYMIDDYYKIERTKEHFLIWHDRGSAKPIVFYNSLITSVEIKEVD